MKIIKTCIGVVSSCPGVRVPSKDRCFAIANQIKKQRALKRRYYSIPKNENCVSESTKNPCYAAKIVKSLKKIHKKLERATLHCPTCSPNHI